MNTKFAVAALLALQSIAGGGVATAQTSDPHRAYEEKCARCHTPHAGEFARRNIDAVGNALLGRHSGRSVEALLARGHGEPTPGEVAALVAHFRAILNSGALFREKCKICHDPAVRLARLELELREGKLIGRYSGRDIEAFLRSHGRLEGDEVKRMVEVLTRQLETRE